MRARNEGGDKKVKTVTVGFVRQVLDMQDFGRCTDKNRDLSSKWLDIEDMLEHPRYQENTDEVDVEIQRLFQELISEANTRCGVHLPKSPEEMMK